ncbi:hypothetical protein TNCV_2799441 [Trichonephila clavipes]|nr:hypothetical protein TNCV_2799441 [Trichonephila clavipes]
MIAYLLCQEAKDFDDRKRKEAVMKKASEKTKKAKSFTRVIKELENIFLPFSLHAETVEVEIEVVSPSIVPSGNFTKLNRTVTCMVLKANYRRTSCPYHAEFRGPRSDYVRQATPDHLLFCAGLEREDIYSSPLLVYDFLRTLGLMDLV